jgi:hypothetical protein
MLGVSGRLPGKKLLGAQASLDLHSGIAVWRSRPENERVSVSHFLVLACLEKLEREKIPVDRKQVLRDGRVKPPQPQKPGLYGEHREHRAELNEEVSSKSASAAKAAAERAAASARRPGPK